MDQRVIGRFSGKMPGPLLIGLGGIHGNEPAGVAALEQVMHLLQEESNTHPEFEYSGAFLALKGNISALALGKRFLHRDLNRMLSEDEIQQLRSLPPDVLVSEETECLELVDLINGEISSDQFTSVLIMDLHTTTASGGVFTIAGDDETSLALAKGTHLPVILGIAQGLRGTTLHYFNRPHENLYCMVVEAGQHQDPDSISRTVSAIINCMRSVGAVDAIHVDMHHDLLLKNVASGFPRVTRLIYHYKIKSGEQFRMVEGYKNFDAVRTGDRIAQNKNGGILAPCDGLILMPKYQEQGDDGFFIVEEVD
jgi:succinylglutamate desuccinylase